MYIYIYMDLSVYNTIICSVLCVWCNIRVLVKNLHYVSDLSELDALLHKTQGSSGTVVPKLNMRRSIILLNRITHQIWHDQPLNQRNKATKKQWGWRLGVRYIEQNLKKGVGSVGWFLIKYGGLGTFFQLCN